MSKPQTPDGESPRKLDVVAFGEALWDLLPDGPVLGGAPLNFAYRMGSLGHTVDLMSCLGTDRLGDRALAQISQLGMGTRYLQRGAAWPTGTVDVRVDERGDPDFTIKAPAAYDHIRVTPDLLARVARADCVCFGTLIQRAPTSRQALARLLEALGDEATILCDINLRKECYTPETVRESLIRAQVLKINETELQEIAILLALSGEELTERVDALIQAMDLDVCLVTLGRRGAYAATRAGKRVYGPAYRVVKKDAAGSGDAFTAGFVHGLLARTDLSLACRMGNALGSLVAGQHGATQPVDHGKWADLIDSQDYESVAPELEKYIP